MDEEKSASTGFALLTLGGLFLIAATYLLLFGRDESPPPQQKIAAPVQPSASPSCETRTESLVMSEEVMMGTIKPEQTVQVEMGYYNCKEPETGDIVVVQTSGRPEPIIRYVKVLPKDQFRIEPRQSNYVLRVNGSVMTNGEGKEYLFTEQKSRLLKLYEKSLKGKMDKDIYFIFSNKIDGGYDSTRFGPIEKSKLIGKVILPQS